MKIFRFSAAFYLFFVASPAFAQGVEFFRSDLATHFGVTSEKSAFMIESVNSTLPDVKGIFVAHISPLPGSVETLSLNDLKSGNTRSLFVGFKGGVVSYLNVAGTMFSRIRGPFRIKLEDGAASLEIGSSTAAVGGASYLSVHMRSSKDDNKGATLGFVGGKLMFNVSGSGAAELRADIGGKSGLTTYSLNERGRLVVEERELAPETPIGILAEGESSSCLNKDAKIAVEQRETDGSVKTEELDHESLLFVTSHRSADSEATQKPYLVAVRFGDDQTTEVYRVTDRKGEKKACLAELVK